MILKFEIGRLYRVTCKQLHTYVRSNERTFSFDFDAKLLIIPTGEILTLLDPNPVCTVFLYKGKKVSVYETKGLMYNNEFFEVVEEE